MGTRDSRGPLLPVDTGILREVFDHRSISEGELPAAEWDHLSYAEYLAASYLARHDVPIATLKRLIMQP